VAEGGGGKVREIKETVYKCPLCSGTIFSIPGNQVNPFDGVSVWCRNKVCTMADWGHGKNERDAFECFEQKLGKGRGG